MGTASAGMFLFLIFLPMIIMLIVGVWLIFASRRGGGKRYPSCGACGYDLSGSVGSVPRCPECGADFKIVGITPPGGSRSRGMLAAGIVLIILPLTCAGGIVVLSLANLYRSNTPTPPPTVTPFTPPPPPGPAPVSDTPGALPPAPQATDDAEIDTTE